MKIDKPIDTTLEQIGEFPEHYFVEPKIDGVRMMVKVDHRGKVHILKPEKEITDKTSLKTYTSVFPEIVQSLQSCSIPNDTLFLGEMSCFDKAIKEPSDLWRYGSNFWKIASRVHLGSDLKIRLAVRHKPATFVAFDLLKLNGEWTNKLTYNERASLYTQELFHPQHGMKYDRVCVVPTMTIEKWSKHWELNGNPRMAFKNCCTHCNMGNGYYGLDLEGVVIKDPNGNQAYKIKMYRESEFKVIGIKSEKKLISSLELEDSNGKRVGHVSWHGEQTNDMAKKLIGKMALVKYMLTQDGNLRFPVLQNIP